MKSMLMPVPRPVRVHEICDVASDIKDPHSPKCIALRARQICRISIRVTQKLGSRGLGVYKPKTEDRRPKTEDRRPKTEKCQKAFFDAKNIKSIKSSSYLTPKH